MFPYSQTNASTAICPEPYSFLDHHHHRRNHHCVNYPLQTPSYNDEIEHNKKNTYQSTQDDNPMCTTTTTSSSPSKTSLPLLNLSTLASPCALSTELCSARRRVENYCNQLTRITPYLYIGGANAARDAHTLQSKHISHIINLSAGRIPNYHQNNPSYNFKYLELYIRDDSTQCIDLIFAPVLQYVRQARNDGTACFIHCCQGISRSVTAAAAFLILDTAISTDMALKEIVKRRPIAAPNHGFVQALYRLEKNTKQGLKRPRVQIITDIPTKHISSKHSVCDMIQNPQNQLIQHLTQDEQQQQQQQQQTTYVAVNLDADYGSLQNDQVYIMEREQWNGVVVWYGKQANHLQWKQAIDIGKRAAMQMEIEQSRALANRDNTQIKSVNVQLIAQGERIDIEREMTQAIRMANVTL